MATADDIEKVKQNITEIFERRKRALYALSLFFAADAIAWFWDVQPPVPNSWGAFWHNKTAQASARMFTKPFQEDDAIGWLMAHGVHYGVYLELANDGKHQSIRPVVNHFMSQFFQDARRLFED